VEAYFASSVTSPDASLWLTRRPLGGPSGYAPVSGACDPARSTSLIREEGLTSAFIAAHELGHVLGLTHDGDSASGNDCSSSSADGAVMAPMVGATFAVFYWSPCSAKEYHLNEANWHCMRNYPEDADDSEPLFVGNAVDISSYSLDDQCRMEFGEDFRFCESFQVLLLGDLVSSAYRVSVERSLHAFVVQPRGFARRLQDQE